MRQFGDKLTRYLEFSETKNLPLRCRWPPKSCMPFLQLCNSLAHDSGDDARVPPDDRPSGEPFCWADWSPRLANLKAPKAPGSHLVEPPIHLAGEMAAINCRTIASSDYELHGSTLSELSVEARRQLFDAALKYTRSYRDVEVPGEPSSLFIAGHQPEMFHPGVWYKNFVLAQMAQEHGAVAVNLQIDSDVIKAGSVRVPTGSVDEPRAESVPFDRSAANLPWEQRQILDRSVFESFGERAVATLSPFVADPLVKKYWPLAVARSRETSLAGCCIAQARHQLEAEWGLQSLEIPQSAVCDLPAMRQLILHLLVRLPRFWETYNTALLEYRREHKVRSSAHPVPELEAEDNWLEAPLWVWSNADPQRRPLYVRQKNDELVLSDRAGFEATLSITAEGEADTAIEQLAALEKRGIRIRTRALITTLAARVLLGDLFVHGIGGAKYDQLTDRIIQRFFGLEPPGYVVVSGTLHIPFANKPMPLNEAKLFQCSRKLQFHPESFVDAAQLGDVLDGRTAADWVAEKRRWIETAQTIDNAKMRCRSIRRANEALQPAVAGLREKWLSALSTHAQQQRAAKLFASREYSFVLFPEVTLTSFLLPVLENGGGSG